MISEIVTKARSIRRFKQQERISADVLRGLVDSARVAASAANLQPLKYITCYAPETCEEVFPTLAWAGYLAEWPGPSEGERPSAYIVILWDTHVAKQPGCDHGIAAQTIVLAAAEMGIGACMIGSVERDRLRELLSIPEEMSILLVLALGRPAEQVVLEEVGPDGDIHYWRDRQGVHHVPKRTLAEVLVREF